MEFEIWDTSPEILLSARELLGENVRQIHVHFYTLLQNWGSVFLYKCYSPHAIDLVRTAFLSTLYYQYTASLLLCQKHYVLGGSATQNCFRICSQDCPRVFLIVIFRKGKEPTNYSVKRTKFRLFKTKDPKNSEKILRKFQICCCLRFS